MPRGCALGEHHVGGKKSARKRLESMTLNL
jgi:hypothetical protein